MPQSVIVRKAFMLAKQLGLSTEQRIDFVNMLIPQAEPLTSWKELTDEQAGRLCDGMEGFALLWTLLVHQGGVDGLDGSGADLGTVDSSEGEDVFPGV